MENFVFFVTFPCFRCTDPIVDYNICSTLHSFRFMWSSVEKCIQIRMQCFFHTGNHIKSWMKINMIRQYKKLTRLIDILDSERNEESRHFDSDINFYFSRNNITQYYPYNLIT